MSLKDHDPGNLVECDIPDGLSQALFIRKPCDLIRAGLHIVAEGIEIRGIEDPEASGLLARHNHRVRGHALRRRRVFVFLDERGIQADIHLFPGHLIRCAGIAVQEFQKRRVLSAPGIDRIDMHGVLQFPEHLQRRLTLRGHGVEGMVPSPAVSHFERVRKQAQPCQKDHQGHNQDKGCGGFSDHRFFHFRPLLLARSRPYTVRASASTVTARSKMIEAKESWPMRNGSLRL